MASIYHLLDDALHIADDIVDKYSQQDKSQKENHYAAIIIQRSYRGYAVRKIYRKQLRAIIVFQKYTRGWLARYHLPDYWQETYDRNCLKLYNNAATVIQAMWRGALVRFQYDIKKIIEEKRRLMGQSKEFYVVDSFDVKGSQGEKDKNNEIEAIQEDKDAPLGACGPLGQEDILLEQIIEMMFDRHHLLSTKVRSGILNTTSELREIEKVLKTLPWKSYMCNMKILYYKYKTYEECKKKPLYHFKNAKMRKEQHLYRLRDKHNDLKEETWRNYIEDTRKPYAFVNKNSRKMTSVICPLFLVVVISHAISRFDLYTKPPAKQHEQSLMLQGKYTRRNLTITRTEDKSKNINKEDFILALKHVVQESKVPPYYADFWYKECWGHYLVE